jgi:hypothetical protein
MSPHDSEDVSTIIAEEGEVFVVLRSPPTAEDDPDYDEVAEFPTRAQARTFLNLLTIPQGAGISHKLKDRS